MLKAIILDFDGVIIDSMDIKTEAFRELFKDFPEHLDTIIDYHLRHGGVSRYRKFAYIYEKILKQPLSREKLEELGEKFSSLVLKKLMKCPFIPGALEFLEEYSGKLNLYVASGTPEEELRRIIKERDLSAYFQGIYGTPALKSQIVNKILAVNGFGKNEVFFIGDSETDYKEARKVGISFIGFLGDSSNPLAEYQIPKVRNFKELKKLLEEVCFNELSTSFIPHK